MLFIFEACQGQYIDPGYSCYDGQWLASSLRCDGKIDCARGEDELECGNFIPNPSGYVKLPEQHQQSRVIDNYGPYEMNQGNAVKKCCLIICFE